MPPTRENFSDEKKNKTNKQEHKQKKNQTRQA